MNSQDIADPLFASLGVINKARPVDSTRRTNWFEMLPPVPFWEVLVMGSHAVREPRDASLGC